MKTVNMHEAKTHLSRLVEDAVRGEPFLIARAGKPVVRVEVIADATPPRIDFLAGAFTVPEDFDRMGADEIRAMFEGEAPA